MTKDVNIVANYDINNFTVTTSSSNCTTTGSGTYQEGSSVTIRATPTSGYNFSYFTVNGTRITTNPYTFTITSNTTVYAYCVANKSYSVTLSGISSYGWTKGSVTNPNSSLYDGVYESLNTGVSSSYGVMKISFTGYTSFTVYIRSSAESNYDYTIASTLDASSYPTANGGSYAKTSTYSNQQSGTAISYYTAVTYSTDGGSHYIYITYRKDGSVNTSPDKGYVLILK